MGSNMGGTLPYRWRIFVTCGPVKHGSRNLSRHLLHQHVFSLIVYRADSATCRIGVLFSVAILNHPFTVTSTPCLHAIAWRDIWPGDYWFCQVIILGVCFWNDLIFLLGCAPLHIKGI